MKKVEVYKLSNGELVEDYQTALEKQKDLDCENKLYNLFYDAVIEEKLGFMMVDDIPFMLGVIKSKEREFFEILKKSLSENTDPTIL